MSDFVIGIGIPPGDLSGARQAEQALGRVDDQARKAGESLRTSGGGGDRAAEGMKKAGDAGAQANDGLIKAAQGARMADDAAAVMRGSFEKLPSLIRDAAGAYGEFTTLLARGGIIASAAAVGYNAGMAIGDAMIEAARTEFKLLEREWQDQLDKLEADAARRKFKFAGLDEEVDRVGKRIKSLQDAMNALRGAEAGTLKAEAGADVAGLRAAAAGEMAGAKTEAERSAIQHQLEVAVAAREAAAEIQALKNAANNAWRDMADMSEIATMQAAAFEAKRAELQGAMANAQNRNDPTAFVRARDELARIDDVRARGTAGVDTAQERARAADAAVEQRQAEYRQRQTELQAEGKAIASALQQALQEAIANATAARSNLTQAQATGGAGQTEAFRAFQEGTAAVDRLAGRIKEMGGDYKAATAAVAAGFSEYHAANAAAIQSLAAQVQTATGQMRALQATVTAAEATARSADTKASNALNIIRTQ